MIERGRCLLLRLDAVELLDAAVHAVHHRIGKVLDPRAPQRALVLGDPDLRDVNQLSHTCPPRGLTLRDDVLERSELLGVAAMACACDRPCTPVPMMASSAAPAPACRAGRTRTP